MKLTFIGADHEVTGSMHLLETSDLKVLIDCGMEQGKNIYQNAELPVSFKEIDYLLLTHAHIDHSGMIPYAYLNGFSGTILTTSASMDLDAIMLLDSAHIQETEAEFANRKGRRAGKEEVEPAYTVEDALNCLRLFKEVPYHETVELSDTVKFRFVDAGHLLGSASIEIWLNDVTEDGTKVEKKIVFSGDIGNHDKPLIRDPEYITEADYVVMESTYGNRLHERGLDHLEDMRRIVQEALDRGGNAVFPAFAVGRTQELLYFIRQMKERNMIQGHDHFPVYVDSPLAVEATKVFHENLTDCYDDETRELVEQGINPIGFDDLHLTVTTEESTEINFSMEPKIIIASAGMCNAGRIRHHLKHNLWRPECSIVFAGYQAEGTLGRALQEGIDRVKLFGEDIAVRAHIETMRDMSSHADMDGLITWAAAFGSLEGRGQFFLVHGEDDAMENLAGLIADKTGNKVDCPYSGSVFDLAKNQWIYMAEPVYTKKETEVQVRNDAVTLDLADAFNELRAVVEQTKVGANADKKKLAEAIRKLAQKYSFN